MANALSPLPAGNKGFAHTINKDCPKNACKSKRLDDRSRLSKTGAKKSGIKPCRLETKAHEKHAGSRVRIPVGRPFEKWLAGFQNRWAVV